MFTITISHFKKLSKGAALCSFNVNIQELGLILRDIRLLETNGKKWLKFPAREYEQDGVKKWFDYIFFTSMAEKDAFCDLVIPLVVAELSKAPEEKADW